MRKLFRIFGSSLLVLYIKSVFIHKSANLETQQIQTTWYYFKVALFWLIFVNIFIEFESWKGNFPNLSSFLVGVGFLVWINFLFWIQISSI